MKFSKAATYMYNIKTKRNTTKKTQSESKVKKNDELFIKKKQKTFMKVDFFSLSASISLNLRHISRLAFKLR